MTLEDILKTTKQDLWDRPDEYVRKQYQKSAEGIVDEQLYKITTALNLSGVGLLLAGASCYILKEIADPNIFYEILHPYSLIGPYPLIASIMGINTGNFIGNDLLYNFHGLNGQILSTTNALPDPLRTAYESKNRIARFPMLLGAGLFSFVDIFGGLPETMTSIVFFSIASSMYLKDRDPKQFKKDPFWKRAYDAVAEKVKEYLPQPFPVPAQVSIPARAYVSVETVASL